MMFISFYLIRGIVLVNIVSNLKRQLPINRLSLLTEEEPKKIFPHKNYTSITNKLKMLEVILNKRKKYCISDGVCSFF